MQIFKPGSSKSSQKYNLFLEAITQQEISGNIYFSRLVIPPSTSSISHCHSEIEYLLVVKGEGILWYENEKYLISQGDFIILEPFELHIIQNDNQNELLSLVSTVLDNPIKVDRYMSNTDTVLYKNILIISTPPTPNGDLHLGHLSGPYLRADILRRFFIMKESMTWHITGQDDHQSYTAYKAVKLASSFRDTANHFGNEIEKTLKMADIEVSYFMKPSTSPNYNSYIEAIFKELWEKNKIIIKNANSLFCDNCDKYLYEAYVRGICPHCNKNTRGNFCESCGKINDCADLVDPACSICDEKPKYVNIPRAYFSLQPYAEQLISYHNNLNICPRLRAYCYEILKNPLPDVPISHLSDWGLHCPIPGLNNHIISVWFEMGIGHLANTKYVLEESIKSSTETEMDFWSSKNNLVVQCFGFDNSFFNCFLFPATYMALNKNIIPAQSLILNEFYCLENLKFSTSRNHLVWAKDFLKEYSSDITRFYLCYTNPQDSQTSFIKKDFEKITYEFNESLLAWLSLLDVLIQEDFNGQAPIKGLWDKGHINFYRMLKQYLQILNEGYSLDYFSPMSITKTLFEMSKQTYLFLKAESHRRFIFKQSDEYRTGITLVLLAVKIFCMGAHPIMPKFTHSLWKSLGYDCSIIWETLPTWIPSKQSINLMGICNNFIKPEGVQA